MKIIKEGNIEKKVTCNYCSCEYEYDAKDICEEYQTSTYNIFSLPNYEKIVRKYVCCPECGEKYYIKKDKPFVEEFFAGDCFCSTVREVKKEY